MQRRIPISLRAELAGVIAVLRMAATPITIDVDNLAVVQGSAAGRHVTVSAKNPAADLWDTYWSLVENFGGGVEILKCKGHATSLDIAEGRATTYTKKGNDGADFYAVAGRDWAEALSPTEEARAAYAEQVKFYRYLLFFQGEWKEDTVVDDIVPSDQADARFRVFDKHYISSSGESFGLHETNPHSIEELGGRFSCNHCRRWAGRYTAASNRKSFFASSCRSVLDRMGEALAKGEAERVEVSEARGASHGGSIEGKAKVERKGRVEATATNCGEVNSARLQENLKKVSDERRREANRLIRPSDFQMAHLHMGIERYGAAVDAHRWANGTSELLRLLERIRVTRRAPNFTTLERTTMKRNSQTSATDATGICRLIFQRMCLRQLGKTL